MKAKISVTHTLEFDVDSIEGLDALIEIVKGKVGGALEKIVTEGTMTVDGRIIETIGGTNLYWFESDGFGEGHDYGFTIGDCKNSPEYVYEWAKANGIWINEYRGETGYPSAGLVIKQKTVNILAKSLEGLDVENTLKNRARFGYCSRKR